MNPMEMNFRIHMTGDWHIGTGAGRPGSTDRRVARDSDGVPYIPAKSFLGIWRDAAEQLAHALDAGNGGAWHRVLVEVFGSSIPRRGEGPSESGTPTPASLELTDARMAEEIRAHARPKGQRAALLREGFTFVQPGVAIEGKTGRAREDHLRFIEMARRGAILDLTASLRQATPTMRKFLIASTMLIERIGGKRRRGAGTCRVELLYSPKDDTREEIVRWLQSDPKPEASVAVAGGEAPAAKPGTTEDGWIHIPLNLALLGPVIVGSRTLGNVRMSLDAIPGTMLLPDITRALGTSRDSVIRGDVRILGGHRRVEGVRGRPAPFVIHVKKGVEPEDAQAGTEIINRLLSALPEGEQFKQTRGGWLGATTGARRPPQASVAKTTRTHNSVDDLRQRPTAVVGGLYSNEAIAPVDAGGPVHFVSGVLIRRSLAGSLGGEKGILEKLGRVKSVRLGSSRKDEYGLTNLTVGAVEPPATCRDVPAGGEVFVWVLSDILLRDRRLKPSASVDDLRTELEARLGIPAGTLKVRDNPGTVSEAVRVRRIETWHTLWVQPRPTLLGIQAGSCVAFTTSQPIPGALLQRVMSAGIGDRRAEGYGEISFGDPVLTEPPRQPAGRAEPKATDAPKPIDGKHPAYGYAGIIETQVWRERIRRAAIRLAGDAPKRKIRLGWDAEQNLPRMSQLGALRGRLQTLRSETDAVGLRKWIGDMMENERRRREWPPGADSSLRNLLDQPAGKVWELIPVGEFPKMTVGAEARLKRDLWAFAVRAVLFACIQAHKRDLEAAQKTEGANR